MGKVAASAPPRSRRKPTYRLPLGFAVAWLLDWLLARPESTRNLALDAARALRRQPEPRVQGLEHVPRDTPFILAANHYSRDGMGIWWTALALTRAVSTPSAPPVRWLSIDRLESFRLLGAIPVPAAVSAWVIRTVGARYRMLLVSRENVQLRSPMLRGARRALHDEGHSIALFPEGIRAFSGGVLAEAFDSSGPVLAWLSDGRFPVLPAAVHDDEMGRIHVRFGEPLVLDRRALRGVDVTSMLMARIAAMLPEQLRGSYAGGAPTDGARADGVRA